MKFCDVEGFAGAFALGMTQAGFELIGKRELPGGFGVGSMEANRHLLGDNWETQVSEWTEWEPVQVDVISANTPCSGFSLLSNSNFRGVDAPINSCMWALAKYAARCGPTIVANESVQGAGKEGHSLMLALRDHLNEVTGKRYLLYHVFMSGATVGAAQIRRRYFWVASQVPLGFGTPWLKRVTTVRDAIVDLEACDPDEPGLQRVELPPTTWSAPLRAHNDLVDAHYRRQNISSQRVEALAPWYRQGENIWRAAQRYEREVGLPLPEPFPHDKTVDDLRPRYGTTPVRLHYDRPSRVLMGGRIFSLVHPVLDRTLTVREGARLMGYDDAWVWNWSNSIHELGSTLAKQIPVQSGRWLATWLRRSLEGKPGPDRGTEIGPDERVVNVTGDYRTWYNERSGEHRLDEKRLREIRWRLVDNGPSLWYDDVDSSLDEGRRDAGKTPQPEGAGHQ